ncbi:Alpha amylase, partial [Operophtera brumata]
PQNPEIKYDHVEELNHTEAQSPEEVKIVQDIYNEIQKHSDVVHRKAENSTVHDDTNTTETTPITNAPAQLTRKELRIDDIYNIPKVPQTSLLTKVYNTITGPFVKFIAVPKVNTVLTNIGTCIVNGVMEIISFVFPAPLIPLIASAAGLIIPFEPIVMLREKMPVTSYRRAFKTAVKGFIGAFDKYKYDDEDPYMTRRFNRRFLGDSKEKNKEDM